MIENLEDTLRKAKKFVFLTGAGISQESGYNDKYNDGSNLFPDYFCLAVLVGCLLLTNPLGLL